MYKGVYEFAGIVVEINSIYDYIHKMSKKYKTNKNAKYVIDISESDIENEKDKSIDDTTSFPPAYLESLAVYRNFLGFASLENVFLFHSSSFMIDDNAFILTAPSGTGKSTHARYLKEVYQDRFKIINDDKPLVKMVGDDFYIYGTPWNGKHGLDNNVSAKVKGIFVLYQCKENVISKMDSSNSFNYIYKQVHRPLGKNEMASVLNMIIKMSKVVPCYHFGCTNSIEAALCSKQIIDRLNEE